MPPNHGMQQVSSHSSHSPIQQCSKYEFFIWDPVYFVILEKPHGLFVELSLTFITPGRILEQIIQSTLRQMFSEAEDVMGA